MRVILCGYHWTGCKALELLLQEGYEVFVYTHETQNCAADLEGLCLRRGIKYSLERISVDNLPFIPDMICSIYYRYIIKKDVIEAVKGHIFNLHPALLPKYRGCSSLTWAMINGEEECGFTYHYIDEGCDTGKVIVQKHIKIEDFDTQLTLYNRVMFESMEYFLEAVHLVEAGYKGEEQGGVSSTYRRGCPLDGIIATSMDWEMKERFVRAMCYPPYPAAKYNNYEIRTYKELEEILGGGYKLVVFGCGGHARSVVDAVHQYEPDVEIIMVDKNAHNCEIILGHKAVKNYDLRDNDRYIIAVGDNAARKKIFLNKKAERCMTVVSINSCIGSSVEIGVGSFVAPFAYIGPQAVIGENTIINSGSIVEHEAVIGSHVHIAPNAVVCGRARIGSNVFCGAGSTIIDKINICSDVTIGAGAVVKEDIIEAGTYVGVPARKVG